MVKRLATSSHDVLGITDSVCKNQSVMFSVQYGPFYTNIPIRSTTIDKSRVAKDPITMHTSRRSNSDITCVTRRDSSAQGETYPARTLHHVETWSSRNIPEMVVRPREIFSNLEGVLCPSPDLFLQSPRVMPDHGRAGPLVIS
ncbi:hypothetical protein F511_19148 [Dorcoceras hygrometricum]|uniref:Uncharacterized protein n=1 Tax=Dorcoceras hygrometricum TaxID=472368 RepID=A0A2Z7BD71_9LAMI|nr:hypothetical protein F511_19148 [Dorcoceras hygrometricum]